MAAEVVAASRGACVISPDKESPLASRQAPGTRGLSLPSHKPSKRGGDSEAPGFRSLPVRRIPGRVFSNQQAPNDIAIGPTSPLPVQGEAWALIGSLHLRPITVSRTGGQSSFLLILRGIVGCLRRSGKREDCAGRYPAFVSRPSYLNLALRRPCPSAGRSVKTGAGRVRAVCRRYRTQAEALF